MGEQKVNGRGRSPGSRLTQFGSPERAARLKNLSTESHGELEVMRHVSSTPPSADTTYQQKHFRRWLHKDVVGFMEMRARLELQAARKAREAPKGKVKKHWDDMTPGEQQEASENSPLAKLLERDGKGKDEEADDPLWGVLKQYEHTPEGETGAGEASKKEAPPGEWRCPRCTLAFSGVRLGNCPACGAIPPGGEPAAPPGGEPDLQPPRLLPCSNHERIGYHEDCEDCVARTWVSIWQLQQGRPT
jgi:rubrerythrin